MQPGIPLKIRFPAFISFLLVFIIFSRNVLVKWFWGLEAFEADALLIRNQKFQVSLYMKQDLSREI